MQALSRAVTNWLGYICERGHNAQDTDHEDEGYAQLLLFVHVELPDDSLRDDKDDDVQNDVDGGPRQNEQVRVKVR